MLDAQLLRAVQVLRKARVALPDRLSEKTPVEQSQIINHEIEKLKACTGNLNARRILDQFGMLPGIGYPGEEIAMAWSSERFANMQEQCSPIDSSIAITSLSPGQSRRIVHQLCVTSWQRMGLHVVAVQHPEEIPQLEPSFPGVEFVAAKRRHYSKPNVWINDLADIAIDRATPVMIINSDIEIRGSQEAFLAKWTPQMGVQTIGVRINHDGLGNSEPEHYGLDVFMLHPDMASLLPELEMLIGVPFWDYWLPYHLRNCGFKIEVLCDSTFWHLKHEQNWSSNDWHMAFEIFKKHYNLSDFSSVHFRKSL